jgi:hypothetical protein
MAKFAYATIHDHNYKALSDITWEQNRKLYCERWGYTPFVKTDNFNPDIKIGFERCFLIKEIMDKNEHDFIFWSGTDTAITNFTIPLDQHIYNGYSITVAPDFNGINNDSMLIRNDKNGKDFIDLMIQLMPEYMDHPFCEQGILMEKYQEYQHVIKLVPQKFMNSYHMPLYCPHKGAKDFNDAFGFNGNWTPGDFLLHCPDQTMDVRISLFNQVLSLVIK